MLKSPTPPPLLGEQGRAKRREIFDQLCEQLPTLDPHIRSKALHLYESLDKRFSPDDLSVCAGLQLTLGHGLSALSVCCADRESLPSWRYGALVLCLTVFSRASLTHYSGNASTGRCVPSLPSSMPRREAAMGQGIRHWRICSKPAS